VVAGGMENMSLIPHYMNLRNGTKFGLYHGWWNAKELVDATTTTQQRLCAAEIYSREIA
jgi:acetyl-CoA acetyltransferase